MSNHRPQRHRGRHWVPLATVLLLILSFLPALISPPGASATDGILIRVHQCPDGYDIYNSTIYEKAADCQIPGAGLPFSIEIPGMNPINATADGNGWVSAGALPSGQTTIYSGIDSNYPQLAYCSIKSLVTETPYNVYYPDQTQFTLFDGEFLDCDWFFAAPTAPSSVLVNKHNCPSTFDFYSASIYDLAQYCHDGDRSGILFTLTGGDGTTANSVTDDNGFAAWSGVAPGSISIVEELPGGYDSARVFCKQSKLTGEETSEDEVQLTDGPTAAIDLQPGWDLYCDWFDASATTVSIHIVKRGCPDGFDWTTYDYASMLEECLAYLDGVQFSLSGENSGNPGGGTTGENGTSGSLDFTGLQPDTLTINEDIPSGYGSPVVFCVITDASGNQLTEVFGPDFLDENSVVVVLDPGNQLYCDWFNVYPFYAEPTATATPSGNATVIAQPSGPATLIVVKRTCIRGFDPLDPESNVQQDCASKTDGIDFQLEDESGDATTATTGEDVAGEAEFDDLDPGSYLLTESYPQGTSAAFVRTCASNVRDFSSYPFAPFAMIGASGSVWVTLLPGETLKCTWYDLPPKLTAQGTGGEGTVVVTKFDCPGANVNPANCDPAGEGIAFVLVSAEGEDLPVQFETDEDGVATVDVAPGLYDLTEAEDDWCFAASDSFDDDSYLDVSADGPTEVTVYNCNQ